MGAIQQDGYTFEMEYSVSYQRGALHVYKDGKFLEEVTFRFSGEKPDEGKIEEMIMNYINGHS
ncbi:hypothetical protein EDD68_10925 [Melghiribacillus thermohalophilus]|uniref:YbxH protein n=1 Tax=Melghiribacillus thermohalophilus TaxID=1324956 RepID=A0A4R3N6B4_9BACI|nr:DUF5370 family protein [Melghiribacillus thermohalophilus]TCT22379.1 hypothetical protein EDD68_10925 [Melghiribacillus thermohalophilus]